jgi:hypothetical protein
MSNGDGLRRTAAVALERVGSDRLLPISVRLAREAVKQVRANESAALSARGTALMRRSVNGELLGLCRGHRPGNAGRRSAHRSHHGRAGPAGLPQV